MNWKDVFIIPADINLSIEIKDLIAKLITENEKRLGINGINEIR